MKLLRLVLRIAAVAALPILGGCAMSSGDANRGPTAVAHAAPTFGTVPLRVAFDGAASIGARPIVAFVWDLGDGSDDSPTSACCEHLYGSPGTFHVRLTVTDDLGRASTCEVAITATNEPPIASLRLSNDAPIVHEAVTFDGSGSVDLDGELVSFLWEFGDGARAAGALATHAYDAVGIYEVRVTIEDDAGARATATHVISVHLAPPGGGCAGGGGIGLR